MYLTLRKEILSIEPSDGQNRGSDLPLSKVMTKTTLSHKVAWELGAQVIQTQHWHLQGRQASPSAVSWERCLLFLMPCQHLPSPRPHHSQPRAGGGVSLLSILSKQENLQEKISELCPGLVKKRICKTTFERHSLCNSWWRLFILRPGTGAAWNTPAFDVRTPAGHMSLQGSFLLSFWLAQ